MTTQLLLAYAVLWATLVKALLVRAQLIPPTCARCGFARERSELGQQICSCHAA
jgi:hypothetical protein